MSKSTPSGDEEYDWLYDYIVTFLKSPPWTVPINRFIDDHCIVFDNDEENKLSFTEIHLKFIELVESLLTNNLSEIGVTEEQFASACAKGSNTALKELVFQQLMAVDDYQIFKKMMVKRNTELELDAMKVLQRAEKHINNKNNKNNNNKDKGKSSAPSAPIAVGDGELSEELQLELALQLSTNPEFLGAIKSSEPIEEVDEAIKASLLAAELYQKELQREQAELEHAMALSMALEQERMKLLQIADNHDDNKKKSSQPSSITTAAASAPTTTPSTSAPTSQPPASKPSPIAPSSGQSSAPAPVSAPSSSSTHPSSSTPSSSIPSSTPSSFSSSTLPPVRTSSTLTSSSLPPLKSTKSSLDSSSSIPDSLSAKTEEFLYAKRVQEDKKKEAIAAGQSTSSMGGLSSEELERRKQFLKAQKEKIIAMRNKERDAELKKYVEENQSMAKQLKSNVSAAAAAATTDKKDTTDTTTDDVEKTREAYRLALAKRLKQDYYDTERRRLETAVAEKFALIQEQLKKVEKVHDEQLLNTIKQQQKSLEIDRQKLDALQKMHQNIAANKLDAASENFHM